MSDLMDKRFLPYTPEELLQHFINGKDEHLKHWRDKIADAPSKPSDWLERDETFWTANALMAIQRSTDCAARWQAIMAKLFGPVPPQLSVWTGATFYGPIWSSTSKSLFRHPTTIGVGSADISTIVKCLRQGGERPHLNGRHLREPRTSTRCC